MVLRLTRREALRSVWDTLAEPRRRELVELYAKLIAQAARVELRDEAERRGGHDGER
jgi:hypothetical protein